MTDAPWDGIMTGAQWCSKSIRALAEPQRGGEVG